MTVLYEPDEQPHWCLDVLAHLGSDQRPPWEGLPAGAIARCTCNRYFVVDERTGLWKRLPRWSRRVREAIAHHDERQQHGGPPWRS